MQVSLLLIPEECQKAVVRLEGFEPPTFALEGHCSIQLSYNRKGWLPFRIGNYGAGEGNRTLAASLEGWNSTTELHPHNFVIIAHDFLIVNNKTDILSKNL